MSGGEHRRPAEVRSRRWRWWYALAGLAVLLVVGAVWAGLTARSAYTHLSSAREHLQAARTALSGTDLAGAKSEFDQAAEDAHAAAGAVDGPLWSLATALPVVGASAVQAQAVAQALDHALIGLEPVVQLLDRLDPEQLVKPDGTVDVAAFQQAVDPLQQARAALATAARTLADAQARTQYRHVMDRVTQASNELAEQITRLDSTLGRAAAVARLAAPLLGADGPRRYFVGILNPNEARGTGGFLGTYAIMRIDSGRMTIEKVGSDGSLPTVPFTPPALGREFVDRYDDGPRLVPNLNMSPHFPDAGLLWLESWRVKTGQRLDGAIAADVVALGDLVTATGQDVTLPDGTTMTGSQLTDFALSGIYTKFPTSADAPARKKFQEAATRGAFDLVLHAGARTEMLTALTQDLRERRIVLWSADPALQQQVLDAGIGGSIAVPPGHHVQFVAINGAATKLDTYLQRSVSYAVGRCIGPEAGQVASEVTVSVTSAIPEGARIPPYVAGGNIGPDGPINATVAEVYLPMGAQVTDVRVNGKRTESYATFTAQHRPAVLLGLTLPPRQAQTVTVAFTEPAADGPGTIAVQPLAQGQTSSVVDRPCG